MEARVKDGPYPSESALFLAYLIFDLRCGRPHRWTPKLWQLAPEKRDELFEKITADFLAGKADPTPTWLEHRIEELVAEELKRRTELDGQQPGA
jgi:hypothetical protein